MSVELLLFRTYLTNTPCEYGVEPTDLTFSANIMLFLVVMLVYLVLVCVALYACFKCNRRHTGWLLLNTLVAVFCPTLYLLVHPNLTLAYSGDSTYCDDF